MDGGDETLECEPNTVPSRPRGTQPLMMRNNSTLAREKSTEVRCIRIKGDSETKLYSKCSIDHERVLVEIEAETTISHLVIVFLRTR